MKKLGKLLPGFSLILFITTLILVVLTSHAFAKYVRMFNLDSFSARPATFEFEATGSEETTIFVDFGQDGETAPVYGTRVIYRTYDFSVRMMESEVATLLSIELDFPSKLYSKVIQADKTAPGVWVNFKLYSVNDLGLTIENLVDLTELGSWMEVREDGSAVWAYNEAVPIGGNPQGKEDRSDFRIEFEVLNVDTSKVDTTDIAIYTTKLGLNVSATQID